MCPETSAFGDATSTSDEKTRPNSKTEQANIDIDLSLAKYLISNCAELESPERQRLRQHRKSPSGTSASCRRRRCCCPCCCCCCCSNVGGGDEEALLRVERMDRVVVVSGLEGATERVAAILAKSNYGELDEAGQETSSGIIIIRGPSNPAKRDSRQPASSKGAGPERGRRRATNSSPPAYLGPPLKVSPRRRQSPTISLVLVLAMLVLGMGTSNNLWLAKATAPSQTPPRITIQPNDLIAVEGEASELNCDAEGDPEPSIEWYHNGQLIKSLTQSRTTMGGSIQFLDIRPPVAGRASDAGIYHCVARNSLGEASSRNASLEVAYIKPDFRLAPAKTKLAPIGESVTLDCLPQAWPEPNIRWRHEGRLIEPHREGHKYSIVKMARAELADSLAGAGAADGLVDVFGSRLLIRQVERADEGRYSCLVETRGSHQLIERESPPTQLKTSVKPHLVEAPQSAGAELGGQVRLRCRMSGEPEPVISWRRQNGQPLSENTRIDPADKSLIIERLSQHEQGAYICEGENGAGSERVSASVSVNSRPKFIVQPDDQEVDQGARVLMKCSGEATPTPMLFWYKEGHRQLMFPPGAPQQPSIYSSSSSTSVLARDVHDSPQAEALVVNDQQFVGSSPISDTSPSTNKLFSLPLGLATPDFSNSYFGNRIYVDNQGNLNIVNASSKDAGYYACAIVSAVGSVLAKAKLTVKQSTNPSKASDLFGSGPDSQAFAGVTTKYDLLPPPVIKFGSTNETLPSGTATTFVCEVVSQVAYKIVWYFNYRPLTDDPRFELLETGTLSIKDLKESDSGVYTCVVTAANEHMIPAGNPYEPIDSSMLTTAPPVPQSTSHSSVLKVASARNPSVQFYRMERYTFPSAPGPAVRQSSHENDGLTITWAAPSDSGSLPIKEYIIEHYDTSKEYQSWTVIYRKKGQELLVIDGLSPEGSHFFVIRAANSMGVGPSSPIAGPMRTVAGDSRYLAEVQKRGGGIDRGYNFDSTLGGPRPDMSIARERLMTVTTNLISLTPLSSTSIKLEWSSQVDSNLSGGSLIGSSINDFLEGFSIRYRATGIGESLLKDSLTGANWSPMKGGQPNSLPLVTSFLDDQEDTIQDSRIKRDLTTQDFDYSQEFKEVRIADHRIEYYTVNGLKPFTVYQFFVVPYYRDIDGVPSNILTAQTNEDRPPIAPPNLSLVPINNTAVRLMWLHVPPTHTNGILRGYVAKINRSDLQDQLLQQGISTEAPTILNLPLQNLGRAPLSSYTPGGTQQISTTQPQYIIFYDLTNLTYKSFYSVQIAAATNVGPGPWTDPQNFVMDAKVLAQLKTSSQNYDDYLTKSLLPGSQMYAPLPSSRNGLSPTHVWVIIMILFVVVLSVAGYVMYRRNNPQMVTWKKTISEHFSNKFYMPNSVDHPGPGSMQQNIYDHQQHLIYSGSTHIAPQAMGANGQPMWVNNSGCINSSGTGSLSSHGGLIPINTDPNNMNRRQNGPAGEQVLIMNNTDMSQRLVKNAPMISQNAILDGGRHHQIVGHGDYYSVINAMSEYEELDQHQQRVVHHTQLNTMGGQQGDRHHTASSNSDASCPSSVTRLLPNSNYNKDLLTKAFNDSPRHEMIMQQHQQQQHPSCYDGKPVFATMMNNGDIGRQNAGPLSPYATTNLMNQSHMHQQQIFANQAGQSFDVVNQNRGQNFIMANGGQTMDDSSKILMNHHHQNSGSHNQISVFRTMQRVNQNHFQRSNGQQNHQQHHLNFHQQQNHNPVMMQSGDRNNQSFSRGMMTKVTNNPLMDVMASNNVYEHVDFTPSNQHSHQNSIVNGLTSGQHFQQSSGNDGISSSTSGGSMRSSSQLSPDQQMAVASARTKKGSAPNETHDLRVFSSVNGQVSNGNMDPAGASVPPATDGMVSKAAQDGDDQEEDQADETTAFRRRPNGIGDSQRSRQMSKRKRQQQRNRLHNNNNTNGIAG